jgi:hypothetical protein
MVYAKESLAQSGERSYKKSLNLLAFRSQKRHMTGTTGVKCGVYWVF